MRSPYASAAILPGAFIPPRQGGTYPLDLDGSLRYTRAASGYSIFPYPRLIGWIQGLWPQQDNLVYAQMYGKLGYGPWTTLFEIKNAGGIFVGQNTKAVSPELTKISG